MLAIILGLIETDRSAIKYNIESSFLLILRPGWEVYKDDRGEIFNRILGS